MNAISVCLHACLDFKHYSYFFSFLLTRMCAALSAFYIVNELLCVCVFRELKDNLGSDEPEGDAPVLLQTMLARNPGIFREQSMETHTCYTL